MTMKKDGIQTRNRKLAARAKKKRINDFFKPFDPRFGSYTAGMGGAGGYLSNPMSQYYGAQMGHQVSISVQNFIHHLWTYEMSSKYCRKIFILHLMKTFLDYVGSTKKSQRATYILLLLSFASFVRNVRPKLIQSIDHQFMSSATMASMGSMAGLADHSVASDPLGLSSSGLLPAASSVASSSAMTSSSGQHHAYGLAANSLSHVTSNSGLPSSMVGASA
jgi:hypothetical protein